LRHATGNGTVVPVEPWLLTLSAGDTTAAWDLFAERYRRLITATIRRLLTDHDDVMDVFSAVCEALTADDCARLRRYSAESVSHATVSTWLVAVVRNLTIDWLRARDGRRRATAPETLTPLQQAIYSLICIDGRSHAEAYEILLVRGAIATPFHAFLREVRVTQQTAPCPKRFARPGSAAVRLSDDLPSPVSEPVESAESVRVIGSALALLTPDVRLAVDLFVVERMSAEDVARAVGWPNAKTVYNRVYRALAAVRTELARRGIGPGDLL
jgi:RNA polymerase sigma factor (sigma-70 family)